MSWVVEALPLSYVEAVVVVGAVLVGAVAGLLGPLSVLAGRSLVGDVLSHGMLPGVATAYLVTGSDALVVLTVGGMLGAGLAAAAATLIERSGRTPPDAALGVALAGSLSLGLVLLAAIGARGQGVTVGLDGYLFGQAAALRMGDLRMIAGVGVVALLVVLVAWRPVKVLTLDRRFGVEHGQPAWLAELVVVVATLAAVVAGVRTVGVILMVALLIGPAVAARRLTRRLAPLLAVSAAVGAAAAGAGAWGSARLGVPTGAGIALLVTAIAVLAVMVPGRRPAPRAVGDVGPAGGPADAPVDGWVDGLAGDAAPSPLGAERLGP